MPRLVLLLALCLSARPVTAALHPVLLREAAVALQADDLPGALAKLQEAAKLRPDYPRIQINLARVQASLGHADAALNALQRLADMGLQMNVTADPAFALLRERPAFQAVAAQLTAGPSATPVEDETNFAITDVTGIIESCLVDTETLDWYFGDVRNRCIWHRDVSTGVGLPQRFTHDSDTLDGVFKIALSPDRKTLWATTATVGVMIGPDAEDGKRSTLVAIDFSTGRVRDRYPVPTNGRKHLLGDFTIAGDGTLYATDSLSPIIWRLPAGGSRLEPWLSHQDFLNLQGLAFSADEKTLYVSDYTNGIWRIAVATQEVTLLVAPATATFFGIDGLYAVPGGLLAVQNGVNPQRVLRIEPASTGPAAARIVALGRGALTDLALGQVFNGRFHFVANSGWALFDPPPATPPAAHIVTINSVGLD